MSKAEIEAKRKQADSYKSQAAMAAESSTYISASYFAAKSLQLYGEASDKDGIAEMKKLVVEYNKKAKTQIDEHEFSVDLDKETVNGLQAIVNSLSGSETLLDNLEYISKSRSLVPDYQTAKSNAEKLPVYTQIFSQITVGDEGHLASLDDFENRQLFTHYGYQMNLRIQLINATFSSLILKKQFTADNIMQAVMSKNAFNVDYLMKLHTGLERRFENDYCSAIHILTPMVEKTFMAISALVGLDTITYNGKEISTRNKDLSSNVLESKEYHDIWSEDFCQMLNYFLYDSNGHKFRHKVAHGDISMADCNFSTSNLMVFFIIKMIFMLKPIQK